MKTTGVLETVFEVEDIHNIFMYLMFTYLLLMFSYNYSNKVMHVFFFPPFLWCHLDIIFRLVDVGGQRSERRKWIHVCIVALPSFIAYLTLPHLHILKLFCSALKMLLLSYFVLLLVNILSLNSLSPL